MSPLDPSTLDSATPRTLDGRSYPDHLRVYEQYDGSFLQALADLEPATVDELAFVVTDAKVRSVLPRWLASAEWRGLVERLNRSMSSQRAYGVTARGYRLLQESL